MITYNLNKLTDVLFRDEVRKTIQQLFTINASLF